MVSKAVIALIRLIDFSLDILETSATMSSDNDCASQVLIADRSSHPHE